MSLLVQIAAEFTGKKALKDADKGIQNLTKSTKKLAGALGVALSATAVINFSKASIKAFAEDEKAANRLAKVVDNLGLSFANPEINKFIENLSLASGVTDDQLRPAFQSLLTTTGSLINSQKMLAQAIDISAGSGIDLATVSQDLANAYVGNTKGLKKYNLGLTQAELKSASFLTIQEKLNKQFSGSNAAYLETYAGKMQLLTTAAGEAQEKIGGALVNALQDVFGAADITELIGKIDILASKTANMIDELAWKWKKFWFATSDKALLSNLNPFSNYVSSGLAKIDAEHAADKWKTAMEKATGFGPDSRSPAGVNSSKMSAAERLAAANAKRLADALKKQTAELKKQALTKKQSALFDMEQIQIIAALKGNISKEERLRLELQLALITGNTAEADKLSQKLANSIDQTGNLAKYLTTLPDANNPFKNWDAFLDAMIAKAREAAAAVGSVGGGAGATPPPTNAPSDYSGFLQNPDTPGSAGSGAQFGPNTPWAQAAQVVVQIDGKAVASALLDQSMSAGQVAYLDRRTGGF